jgi:thymidylate synthase (FAD)
MVQRKSDDQSTSKSENMRQSAEAETRASVAELDGILGRAFRVLDDGFVRVVDYMGDDTAVAQAARVSYGAGTKRIRDDRALIRYLMRHSHTTPLEMCEIKLHVRVPIDTWRQWIRHRTANVNEYSTRYSIAIDAAQRTPASEWRQQSQENRQGSAGHLAVDTGSRLSSAERELQERARAVYEDRIAAGVAREQARKDLPLSTYTESYWKIDLHNLLHFLVLRMHEHAQEEIRSYAKIIGEEIVAKWVPIVWEAFLDYKRNSVQLSNIEAQIIAALASGDSERVKTLAGRYGMLNRGPDGKPKPNRERGELEEKLLRLGLKYEW